MREMEQTPDRLATEKGGGVGGGAKFAVRWPAFSR